MADQLKSIKKNGYYMKRLQCDCMDPSHCLDLTMYFWDPHTVSPEIEFCESFLARNRSLLGKIKLAMKAILGRELLDHGFCVREEDIPEVEEFFQTLKDEVAKRK